MGKLLIISLSAIFLAACSPEKIFSLIAKSDVEHASSELVNNSTETINQIDQVIADKQVEYGETTKLESPSGDGSYAYLFQKTNENGKTDVEVIAVLPPLEKEESFYEVWLVKPNNNDRMSIGPLFLNESDNSRSLTFSTQKDISIYTRIQVTVQTNPNQQTAGDVSLEGSLIN